MKSKTVIFGIISLLLLIISFLAVTSWSLWLDETMTARMFSVSSFPDLLNEFKTRPGSESQMPGWIFSMWLWVKVFGNGEYALRAANLIYVLLFFIYVGYLYFKKSTNENDSRFLIFILVLSIVNPLILYNINEARCNVAIYFLSMISILGLWSYYKGSKSGAVVCSLFFFIVSSFNMLSGLLAFGLLAMILSYSKNIWSDIKKNKITISILLLALIALFGYYIFTLINGNGGIQGRPGIWNIGYVMYEFMGFSGIGPNKNILRESSDQIALLVKYVPVFLLFILSYIFIFVCLIRKKGFKNTFSNVFLKAFIINFVIFFIFAYIAQFRFWGRHVLFIYPFFILYLANMVTNLTMLKTKIKYPVLALFFSILIFSSGNILFSKEYKKEDVRLAAAKAKELRRTNEKIIWTEGEEAASYYGLNSDSIELKIGFPDPEDTGILVSFNRIIIYPDDAIKIPIEELTKDTLFVNRDFTIYRIRNNEH